MNFLPFLEHVPGDPLKARKVLAGVDHIMSFIGRQMVGHAQVHTEKEEEEATDFIHAYIRQIRKHEASGNTNTTINGSFFPLP